MKRVVFSLCVPVVWLGLSGSVLANNIVTGSSSAASVDLTSSDNWTVIRSVTVNILAFDFSGHGCVAIASADMDHEGDPGVANRYRFVLTRNNTNPLTDTGSERVLELTNNEGINDPNSKPVATTQHFTGLTNDNGANGTGAHTFYFLGRKVTGATSANVLDASLSVICVDTP